MCDIGPRSLIRDVADLKKKGDLAELKVATDLLAVYDRTSDRCYYIHAAELGSGRAMIHLRLSETRNGQRAGIRFAKDFEDFPYPRWLSRLQGMELAGLLSNPRLHVDLRAAMR
jgi:hypothetical protein